MKTRLLSLTVLLLASAASGALAQDRSPREGGDAADQPTGGVMQRAAREARARHEAAAPEAKPAVSAPAAPPPRGVRPDARGVDRDPDRGPGRGPPPAGGVRVQEHDRRVEDRRPDRDPVPHATDRDQARGPDRSPDRGRPGWDRQDGDRRPPSGREDHRDDRRGDRHDDRGRPDGGWDRGRNHDGDRDRDHGRRDGPRWEQHRYPPIYNSPSRYHGPSWRPPYGYYARVWRFGDILPRGWYEPQYQILDWWAYDLPEPPYGYDWVRIGRDALLIDGYTGRIVQVVRLVFW
jgi:Ni/Co efflux regulator RcnB